MNQQAIILDIRNSEKNFYEDKYSIDFTYYYSFLNKNGLLWIICRNIAESDRLVPFPFLIAEKAKKSGFLIKNIIVWPNFNGKKKSIIFTDVITYLVMLSKTNDFYLNIDAVREKHIWKDVEWGKRKENYHRLGKNPGNVWLKTEDDGHGRITKHVPLTDEEVLERIIFSSSKKNDTVVIISNKQVKNILDRKIQYGKI